MRASWRFLSWTGLIRTVLLVMGAYYLPCLAASQLDLHQVQIVAEAVLISWVILSCILVMAYSAVIKQKANRSWKLFEFGLNLWLVLTGAFFTLLYFSSFA